MGWEVTWVATFTITQQLGSSLTQSDETAPIWHRSPWPLAPWQAYTWPKPAPVLCAMEQGKPNIHSPQLRLCKNKGCQIYIWESNTVLYSSLQCTCTLWAVFARSHLSSGLWHVFMLLSSLPFTMKKKQIHGALQISREETRAAELRWVLICSRGGHKHTQKK